MINFSHQESELAAAVGLPVSAILAEAGAECAPGLERLRSRYQGYLRHSGDLGQAERLDRDRLESLLGELYGAAGLLAQAGALLCLRERLRQASSLVLACHTQPGLTPRLRREALILRSFASSRLPRGPLPQAPAIIGAVTALAATLARLDDFSLEVEALDRHLGHRRTGRLLKGVARVADDWPAPATVGDLLSFALHHLADTGNVKAAAKDYDTLCQVHARRLREELWECAEAGLSRRPAPARLDELAQLDVTLELLCARLCDAKLEGAARCSTIAELYSLLASSRAIEAAQDAQRAVQPLLELLRAGIQAEERA